MAAKPEPLTKRVRRLEGDVDDLQRHRNTYANVTSLKIQIQDLREELAALRERLGLEPLVSTVVFPRK